MEGPRDRTFVVLVALIAATSACPGTLEDPERFLAAAGGDSGSAQGIQPPVGSEAGGGGSGGGGSGSGGSGGGSSACPDIPGLLGQTCTASGCHNASSKAQGLDLQSPDLASRLVGAPATEGPGLLIDPSTPSNSILYEKLTAMPPFGARMPLGGAPLDSATLACVLAWITQEASSAGAGEGGAPGGGADATSD